MEGATRKAREGEEFAHEPLRSEEGPAPRRAAWLGEALSRETGSDPGLPNFQREYVGAGVTCHTNGRTLTPTATPWTRNDIGWGQ